MNRKMKTFVLATVISVGVAGVLTTGFVLSKPATPSPRMPADAIMDSHVHLTNYIQEGTDIRDMLRVMSNRVSRATLFGIPLQQTWSHAIDQDDAPTYYLESDAPLYYYSFTDAHIATAYRSLTKAEQDRFDPMITGFNPADMYAADHVRRVLETYPGVFVGIGEFSLHKEFVTSKIAGGPPSLDDPALDRLLEFAAEVGLVTLVHCDADTPFPKPGAKPAYFDEVKDLFAEHPNTTIIWAHAGVGRVVRPIQDHLKHVEAMLDDPKLRHVVFDLSWSETAKYIVASPETVKVTASLIAKHPDRFLFGTDEVAPQTTSDYLRVYRQYQPLWDALPRSVVARVTRGNYVRIFDEARRKVRAWERQHVRTRKPQHAGASRP